MLNASVEMVHILTISPRDVMSVMLLAIRAPMELQRDAHPASNFNSGYSAGRCVSAMTLTMSNLLTRIQNAK